MDLPRYRMHEISELASFISVMDFHPLSWRAAHPYVLVKCFEDVTALERVDKDEKCDRDIILCGYLRGCDINKGTKVHIAGVGDFPLYGVTSLRDPFPLRCTHKKKRFRGKEIFKTGSYLKLEVRDVPFEMVKSFDRSHPILVGGIGSEEEYAGYVQVTLKRHSWHKKLLKTRDIIIVSIGWKRYQTSPIYAMEDSHGRLQMLDDTPEDMECRAIFWGPRAPPNTEVVVVQSLADHKAAFRILATAVVLDCNHAAKILKKCKRVGTPLKIINMTAFIKGMFTSDLVIDRFKNQRILTNSGILGKIKKAADKELVDGLKLKEGLSREGITECTFKDNIHMSDIVILHVWRQEEVSQFFNPLMTALDPTPSDRIWEHSILQCAEPVDVLPVSKDLVNKQEEIEENMTKNQQIKELLKKLEEKKKAKALKEYPVGSRRTLEQRRRVIFVEGEPRVRTFPKVRRKCSQVSSDF
ncbi:ribosome biogenesis protein BMS1 homolog isoform X1 [Papaver somniferum]|uniref:ribosome biogenesis protein BMS1 homolog isoform X1 n=1 Tax=Papaver somniferum TaxID=3469 RepID=UPI000E6F9609|nr:ribosome biogenesis protein BMS1 homolog isoform X1 [Papaver somniferum]